MRFTSWWWNTGRIMRNVLGYGSPTRWANRSMWRLIIAPLARLITFGGGRRRLRL